ncbi:SHC-transforming protein 1 [Bicyclus anynana]|uniref:SHC-transforming protein 1 n=1 Tax=Bicyclus anynana TaxID=110368 RepID=A0ABM3LM42_BICAN|nr:SHC-transforming protein 1 [Bicyclus anynana]
MGDNGPFVAKPARGWLHPDSVLAADGITYAVRYIGCMEVLTSMKKLDFETRSQVAKECIARVCAAAGLRSADKKRRVCQAAANALAARPRMSHSGSNVALTVSSRAITLAALEGGETIARHDMPRVSFASGGDQDSLDFVAYVAKSAPPTEWRACYVLECGGRLSQDVIATIGQAFELRFKEFLTKPQSLNINGSRGLCGAGEAAAGIDERERDYREYYNDMPDKIPPPEPFSHRHPPPPPLASLAPISSCEESVRHYVNQTPPPRTPPTALLPTHSTDIFDMQPFTAAPVSSATSTSPATSSSPAEDVPPTLSPTTQAALLARESWYHGPISRSAAERLVVEEGEFLVRQSTACPGQFVLTGARRGAHKHLLLVDPNGVVRHLHSYCQLVVEEGEFLVRQSTACPGQFVLTGARRGAHKHLLLVDPNGVVRTKDRVFESVPHLIKYHCSNELPIVSADSALLLRAPVPRPS